MDGELLRQHEGGFLRTDSFQTGNKVNHIPVCLTAEAMETPVNLHAGVFIVMDGSSYKSWLGHRARPSLRDLLCAAIDAALEEDPVDFDALLSLVSGAG